MLDPDEKHDGTIRVYFVDNTYKTLPVKFDTTTGDVSAWLCRRLGAASSPSSRPTDPSRYELLIIAPGTQSFRERRLLREDKPLQIQAKGGASAFKFLFREIQTTELPDGLPGASVGGEDSGQTPDSPGGVVAALPSTSDGAPDSPGPPRGTLERLLDDGETWHSGTVILDEDRLWYSQAPSAEDGAVGGGMVYLMLSDCYRVVEYDDKRVLQLVTKSGKISFRARTNNDRNAWLLAVVKQAALVKERDILLVADGMIRDIEHRRSSQQLARLEAFSTLPGLLAVAETRELFFEFVRREHQDAAVAEWAENAQKAPTGGHPLPLAAYQPVAWPHDLNLEAVIHCLERRTIEIAKVAAEHAGQAHAGDGVFASALQELPQQQPQEVESCSMSPQDAEAWDFVDASLMPRFRDHEAFQRQVCRIAAGIV